MREEAFRRFLAQRLGARSVNNYLSNLRRAERVLALEVDTLMIDDHAIDAVRMRLKGQGLTAKKVTDCLSALCTYAAFQDEQFVSGSTLKTSTDPILQGAIKPPHAPTGLAHIPTADLLADYAAILRELRTRGVSRTRNGPVGDYAEHLFARAFGWALEPNSTAGFDARDKITGLRYEIKARRAAQLSALRGLPERRFDRLAVLLFAPDFSINTAVLIPHELVMLRAVYIAHTNSWRLVITSSLLALRGIEDVTRSIAAAAVARDAIIT